MYPPWNTGVCALTLSMVRVQPLPPWRGADALDLAACLRAYSLAGGHGELALDAAIPDRHDRIEAMMAEGDTVWMRFNTGGTHSGGLAGIAPTGKQVGVNVAMIARFVDGRWVESWTFADELGFMLQLGQQDRLF